MWMADVRWVRGLPGRRARAGGLSENDFIVAARMNAVSIDDLKAQKKARFWA
jgi:hypothetical protein